MKAISFLDVVMYLVVGFSTSLVAALVIALLCFSLNILPSGFWLPPMNAILIGLFGGGVFMLLSKLGINERSSGFKIKLLLVALFLGLVSFTVIGVQMRTDQIPLSQFRSVAGP